MLQRPKTAHLKTRATVSLDNFKTLDKEDKEDKELKKLQHQKHLHEQRLQLLRQETNNVLNALSGLDHITNNTVTSSLIHNKSILHNVNNQINNNTNPPQPNIVNNEVVRRNSFKRRRSSAFQDIYEIKRLPTNTGADLARSKGFTKTHLFDVYLQDNKSNASKRERLPSIINLYNNALKLSLIEKLNPTTKQSFNHLLTQNPHKKSTKNPVYDFKSNSLVFDGIKVKKTPMQSTQPITAKILNPKK